MTNPIKETFHYSGAEKIASAFMEISVALTIIALLGVIDIFRNSLWPSGAISRSDRANSYALPQPQASLPA